MLTVLLGGVVGLAIGFARGGTVSSLAEVRLRARACPCLAVLVQVASGLLPSDRRFLAIDATYALLAIWLFRNVVVRRGRLRHAFGLLTAGWTLNTLPIVLNGGMPVSLHALHAVGAPRGLAVGDGHLFKHVAAGAGTKLAPLGDVIAVPPLRTVISVGDIVIAFAVAFVLAVGMTTRQTPLATDEEPDGVAVPSAVLVGAQGHRLDVGLPHVPATVSDNARDPTVLSPSHDCSRRESRQLRRRFDRYKLLVSLGNVAFHRHLPRPFFTEGPTGIRTE